LPPDDLPPDDFPFPPGILNDYAEFIEYFISMVQIEIQGGDSLIEYSNVDGLYFDVVGRRALLSAKDMICQSEF
jgi:hypothetical protein